MNPNELIEIRNQQLKERQAANQWFSEKQICSRLGLGKTTLRRWILLGEFPCGKVLGGRTIRWNISTIHDWENKRQGINQ